MLFGQFPEDLDVVQETPFSANRNRRSSSFQNDFRSAAQAPANCPSDARMRVCWAPLHGIARGNPPPRVASLCRCDWSSPKVSYGAKWRGFTRNGLVMPGVCITKSEKIRVFHGIHQMLTQSFLKHGTGGSHIFTRRHGAGAGTRRPRRERRKRWWKWFPPGTPNPGTSGNWLKNGAWSWHGAKKGHDKKSGCRIQTPPKRRCLNGDVWHDKSGKVINYQPTIRPHRFGGEGVLIGVQYGHTKCSSHIC